MTGSMGHQLAMQDVRTEADAVVAARRQAMQARANRQDAQQRRAILTRTVELDVIPRLLAARLGTVVPVVPALVIPVVEVSGAQVTDLVSLVLDRGEPEAVAFVEAMHDEGTPAEAIYLNLLAPAARRLGELWECDQCDIAEVTIGLWRLHNTMRELAPAFGRGLDITGRGPRALLVPLPGETHTFGLAMVHEFFCRAGWDAWTGPIGRSDDLRAMVRHDWVDVVGFSMACDDKLDAVRAEIRALRRVSLNPRLGIMVGGPGFTASPSLAAEVGADGTATDGRQAVREAQSLVDRALVNRALVDRNTADRSAGTRPTKRR